MIWKNILYRCHGFIVLHHCFRNYLAEGCIFTMTHSALFWYLDFEGYQVYGTFYVKEISILKNDRTQCWTYHITQQYIEAPTSFEFLRHAAQLKLEWCFGDYFIFILFKNFIDEQSIMIYKIENEDKEICKNSLTGN